MKTFAVLYFFALGYLAKKYEIPQRIADFALEGVGEMSRLAGREFSRGMVEVGPEIDPPKKPRFSEPLIPGE